MKMAHQAVKYIFFIALLLLFMAAGQFAQLMRSNDDARYYVLENWAGSDKDRQAQVTGFMQTCLPTGTKAKKDTFKETVEKDQKDSGSEISFKKCADENGYSELYFVVFKEADSILKSVSWPLSLIIDL